MKINTEIIKQLNPCQDRLVNWMQYYPKFNGDVSKFFKLENITHQDKLWVVLRLVDNDIKVIFALDCAFSAYAASYAAYDASYYTAADAANAAAYAAYTAAYTDADAAAYAAADAAADVARKVEQENQLNALLYLIKGEGNES